MTRCAPSSIPQRLLRTERQRLDEELGRARTNLVKAEELLNAREKALSPTMWVGAGVACVDGISPKS